jgi:hypothetical protein
MSNAASWRGKAKLHRKTRNTAREVDFRPGAFGPEEERDCLGLGAGFFQGGNFYYRLEAIASSPSGRQWRRATQEFSGPRLKWAAILNILGCGQRKK